MKKLILLGLTVIGIGAAGTSAQAGGFVVVNPFCCLPVLPPPPKFAPAVVFPQVVCARFISGARLMVPTFTRAATAGTATVMDLVYRWFNRHDR